jgi:hypothetical protein
MGLPDRISLPGGSRLDPTLTTPVVAGVVDSIPFCLSPFRSAWIEIQSGTVNHLNTSGSARSRNPETLVGSTMTANDIQVPPPPISSPPLTKITTRNRRLTYLNRSEYLSSPTIQERLFPLLYEKLILRHETSAEKATAEVTSKQRSLTNVLLEAGDHMEKVQRQRDRTDDDRARDEVQREMEAQIAEMTPQRILDDRQESHDLLERMMREKFLAGGDEEFDYPSVDEDDQWDDWETVEEDIRAEYFDNETPEEELEDGRVLTGQTGVQDF